MQKISPAALDTHIFVFILVPTSPRYILAPLPPKKILRTSLGSMMVTTSVEFA